MERRIKIYICDDDIQFIDLIIDYLSDKPELEIIGYSDCASDLICKISSNELFIDILLLDINLEEVYKGIELAAEVAGLNKNIKTIFFSSLNDDEIIYNAMTITNARGYILKSDFKNMVHIINNVWDERNSVSQDAMDKFLNYARKSRDSDIKSEFTDRQIQIIKLLQQELKIEEIANQLFFSSRTVEDEICKIKGKIKKHYSYFSSVRYITRTKDIIEFSKKHNIIS